MENILLAEHPIEPNLLSAFQPFLGTHLSTIRTHFISFPTGNSEKKYHLFNYCQFLFQTKKKIAFIEVQTNNSYNECFGELNNISLNLKYENPPKFNTHEERNSFLGQYYRQGSTLKLDNGSAILTEVLIFGYAAQGVLDSNFTFYQKHHSELKSLDYKVQTIEGIILKFDKTDSIVLTVDFQHEFELSFWDGTKEPNILNQKNSLGWTIKPLYRISHADAIPHA